jgi:hypothetical protein
VTERTSPRGRNWLAARFQQLKSPTTATGPSLPGRIKVTLTWSPRLVGSQRVMIGLLRRNPPSVLQKLPTNSAISQRRNAGTILSPSSLTAIDTGSDGQWFNDDQAPRLTNRTASAARRHHRSDPSPVRSTTWAKRQDFELALSLLNRDESAPGRVPSPSRSAIWQSRLASSLPAPLYLPPWRSFEWKERCRDRYFERERPEP